MWFEVRFGPAPVTQALGAVLAHSLRTGARRLRKGRLLEVEDIAALAEAGITEVTVARLDPGDMGEDAAAEAVARALAPEPDALGLAVSAAFTGRVNLLAAAPGVLGIERAMIDALNAVDPAITLASLPPFARVQAQQIVATLKIIPFGLPGATVARAIAAIGGAGLRVHGFRPGTASLIQTRLPGMKASLIEKGAEIIRGRLRTLSHELLEPAAVAHDSAAVAEAVRAAPGDMILILGASATSDAGDICPAGLVAAGGRLERLGMPVDPGNLLFLGDYGGRPVIGMPGSARSPALSGVDWVLERLAAGLSLGADEIAAMGVGGLLKEIPVRPQPRASLRETGSRPRIAAIVLAAGASRRMLGRDKLLEPVGGRAVLRVVAEAAMASRAETVKVVLPPEASERHAVLEGLAVERVVATDCAEGMAASLRAGLAALAGQIDAVVILLSDMPEVTAAQIDALIAAFDPARGHEICRAVSSDGAPGHPVLFGRRFFESLSVLTGDRGARDVVRAAAEFVVDVPTPGRAAVTDLDTPEAWAAWHARSGA